MTTPREHAAWTIPDIHKGAIEGDTPTDEQNVSNPRATASTRTGLPNDPVATAQDKEGANADKTQG